MATINHSMTSLRESRIFPKLSPRNKIWRRNNLQNPYNRYSPQSLPKGEGVFSFQFSVVNENLSVIGHSVSRNRLFISLKTEN